LVDTAKTGYGKSQKEVKGLVEKVARDKRVLKKLKVTDGWFKRFLERQLSHFERAMPLQM